VREGARVYDRSPGYVPSFSPRNVHYICGQKKHRRVIIVEKYRVKTGWKPRKKSHGASRSSYRVHKIPFAKQNAGSIFFLLINLIIQLNCTNQLGSLVFCRLFVDAVLCMRYNYRLAEIRGKLITTGVTYSRENLSSAIPITLS